MEDHESQPENDALPDMGIAELYRDYLAEASSIQLGKLLDEDQERRMKQYRTEIRRRYANPTDAEVDWLLETIGTSQGSWRKRGFVTLAVKAMKSLDERFLMALVMGGVKEPDPSFNKQFIEPAVTRFGIRRVLECLFEVLKSGDPYQQSGAVNALYWAQEPLVYKGDVKEFTIENATPESREAYLSVADIRREISLYMLELFVATGSVRLQQCIILHLNLSKPHKYPPTHRHLFDRAVEIARSHTDDYIRHRFEVQLGRQQLLAPLPRADDLENPESLKRMQNLVDTYVKAGQPVIARMLQEMALAVQRKILPAGHEDIGKSIMLLAELYEKSGHKREAAALRKQAKQKPS